MILFLPPPYSFKDEEGILQPHEKMLNQFFVVRGQYLETVGILPSMDIFQPMTYILHGAGFYIKLNDAFCLN